MSTATHPSGAADLRHYTPEELVDPEGEIRLPTTARTLREWAYARRIPCRKVSGRITFTADDIRAINAQFAVPAVADQRRAA